MAAGAVAAIDSSSSFSFSYSSALKYSKPSGASSSLSFGRGGS
jgi:hypothetical protein